MALLLGGCGPRLTQFDIIDFRESGTAERYFQDFDTCYYCYDAQGNLDVVAHRESRSAEGISTTQVVHLHTFWVSHPGRTLADRTMLNATVSYLIVSGPTGASFEGSGFLSFRENRAKDRISGELELSFLRPQRRLGSAERLFERAQLSGRILAERNKPKVVSMINEMKRLFGPMPRYDPPPEDPTLR